MLHHKNLPKDFDWKFYLSHHKDLSDFGYTTEKQAIKHFLIYGYDENRIYKPYVDQNFDRIDDYNIKKKIFENLCEKLLKFVTNRFPIVDKNSKFKSLIVETRWSKSIEFTIKNTIQKLGDGWGHIIVCNNNNYYEICKLKKQINDDLSIINLGEKQIDRNSYNNLLLSIDFWKKIQCEKVLIYQSDTFIFKNFDNLFLDYDYLGSRWGPSAISRSILKYKYPNEVFFGNGGLSFRNVNCMIEILSQNKIIPNLEPGTDLIFEDIFFSNNLPKKNYKYPDFETIDRFSFEHFFNDYSFGCHQPFVSTILTDCLFEKFLSRFNGVNIYGLGNYRLGLGQNMRVIIDALEIAKIPYTIKNIELRLESSHEYEDDEHNFFDTNLFLVNPDCFDFSKISKNKKNIALWAWELDVLPKRWIDDSKYLDEIWTISSFCKESIQTNIKNTTIKQINIPSKFLQKRDKTECKRKLNLENKFICLFVYDSKSDDVRKNPLAVIQSFNKSLSSKKDCHLIIKTQNCEDEKILNYKSENITIINETFNTDEITNLFNCADIYISLHRAEGSGFTIMEAIDLEIPVVCTNYSGNLDFCDDNCQLVDYELVSLTKAKHLDYVSLENIAHWSEPSIEDAAEKLLNVYNNYTNFSEKIKLTKEKLHKKYNLNFLSNQLKSLLIDERKFTVN